MLTDFQIHDLIALLRVRYPAWDSVDFPLFVADELDYKRETIAKAQTLIGADALDKLLAQGAYDDILAHLDQLGRATNLLWLRIPKASDLAVLKQPRLNKAEFCTQFRNLLYGDQPSPQRLQFFSDYLEAQQLPNGWPFATYFLFLSQPETEMFVKPNTAKWLLQFVGATTTSVRRPPDGATYTAVLQASQQILHGFTRYGAVDMVDVQSLVWVCAQESQRRVGRLSAEGQVALDVPPDEEEVVREQTAVLPPTLKEPTASYTATTEPYSLADLAAETAVSAATLSTWIAAIRRKGQAIFYGPPGTGKTYLAQKLAQHLTHADNGLVELIQFHPAYSYEDFMQGLRPLSDLDGTLHYEVVPGRFLSFCTEAARLSAPCVLIIDEINRANLAAVFGELMYLLEYREQTIGLAGNGRFRIPHNVIILGTMNTADRSIALVDYALRRRFAFIHLTPNFELLRRHHPSNPTLINNLIALLTRLNNQINDPNYAIGPTYFLHENLADILEAVWTMEIEPYLEEYFFDQPRRLDAFRWTAVREQLTAR